MDRDVPETPMVGRHDDRAHRGDVLGARHPHAKEPADHRAPEYLAQLLVSPIPWGILAPAGISRRTVAATSRIVERPVTSLSASLMPKRCSRATARSAHASESSPRSTSRTSGVGAAPAEGWSSATRPATTSSIEVPRRSSALIADTTVGDGVRLFGGGLERAGLESGSPVPTRRISPLATRTKQQAGSRHEAV